MPSPDGAPPAGKVISHAISLVHLEEGKDAAAVEFLRPIFERPSPTSRSSLDATILLLRALAEPEALRVAEVTETIERSRQHWSDLPSSFITWAAVTAYTSLGAAAEADALLWSFNRTAPDIFIKLARMQRYVLEHRAAEVVEVASGIVGELPRFQVLADLTYVTALLQLGQESTAVAKLRAMWREHPAPRLVRFAMRFLTDGAVRALLALEPQLPDDLAAALGAAADDPRPLRDAPRPTLTSAERSVLLLLRAGLKNKDIAEQRGVTLDTLRTQLKSLYRKLGVGNRSEAVAVAADWRLFEPGP